MKLAECPVDADILGAWHRHFVPPAQPFFVSDELTRRFPNWLPFTRAEFGNSAVPLSLNDTFITYHVTADPPWVSWLTPDVFRSLDATDRSALLREQHTWGRGSIFRLDDVENQLEPATFNAVAAHAEGGLFVWWLYLWQLLSDAEKWEVLRAFVEADPLPSRHAEITPEHWDEVATVLPGARILAGTFLPDSGGNCLATVIAAFGVPCVDDRWVHPEPFERWLARLTLVGDDQKGFEKQDESLGHVLVWRDGRGRVQHAAVSLGQGYLLHKEAQGWFAPRQVSTFNETLPRWRDAGEVSVYKTK